MSDGDSLARDLLVAAAVVGGIILALVLYTGNWPPPVVVESNSMMHVDEAEYEGNVGDTRAEDVPFGRAGTIDPGDLVLVKQFDTVESISTYADEEESRYGSVGEVVVYFPGGDQRRTPIIHRAMTYVEVDDTSEGPRTYEVRWHSDWDRNVGCDSPDDNECVQPGECSENGRGRLTCTFEHGFRLPALLRKGGSHVYQPSNSGFITQGDNVAGNQAPDQATPAFDRGPVEGEWIKGVARGELPWFGLIKLAVTGEPGNTVGVRDHPYYATIGFMTAAQDLWVMLVVGLGVVAFAPVGVDYGIHLVRRRLSTDRRPPPGTRETTAPPEEEAAGDEVRIDLE